MKPLPDKYGQPPFPVLSGRVYQILELMKPLLWGEQRFEMWGPNDSLVTSLFTECVNVPERPHEIETVSRVKTRVIVLMSGGIDSTIAYHMMVQRYGANCVGGLFLDIGQPYAKKEADALHSLDRIEPLWEFLFADLFNMEEMAIAMRSQMVDWKHIIPLRNWLFLEMAACYAADAIVFSVLRGEQPKTGGDKSRRFTNIMRCHFRAKYGLELLMPLSEMTKADAIGWFLNRCSLGTQEWREEQLHKTVTCFSGKPGHCGKCQACLRRYIAGKVAGIEFEFNEHHRPDIAAIPYVEKYIRLMTKALRERDFSRYDERRCRQFMSVLLRPKEYEDLIEEVDSNT